MTATGTGTAAAPRDRICLPWDSEGTWHVARSPAARTADAQCLPSFPDILMKLAYRPSLLAVGGAQWPFITDPIPNPSAEYPFGHARHRTHVPRSAQPGPTGGLGGHPLPIPGVRAKAKHAH